MEISIGDVTKEISVGDVDELYKLCEQKKIHLNQAQSGKQRCRSVLFGTHRACILGYVYKRAKPRSNGKVLSSASITRKDLYECLIRISNKYFKDFQYSTIQLNHNVCCSPHKDTNNNGDSIMFSIGDYIGGELVIERDNGIIETVNTNRRLFQFDGAKYTHYNNPIIGNKYSFIFFK